MPPAAARRHRGFSPSYYPLVSLCLCVERDSHTKTRRHRGFSPRAEGRYGNLPYARCAVPPATHLRGASQVCTLVIHESHECTRMGNSRRAASHSRRRLTQRHEGTEGFLRGQRAGMETCPTLAVRSHLRRTSEVRRRFARSLSTNNTNAREWKIHVGRLPIAAVGRGQVWKPALRFPIRVDWRYSRLQCVGRLPIAALGLPGPLPPCPASWYNGCG